MRRAIVQAVAGAAMVVALAAGCGSGDSNDSADTGGGTSASSDAGSSGTGAGASGGADASENASGAGASEGAGGGDAAAKVTAAIDQSTQTAPVTFTTESAELSEPSKQTLKTIADAMQGNDVKLMVNTSAGYPDAAKSKTLSEQRAQAIVAAFGEYGVGADRITTNATGNENAKGEQALQTQITVE